MSNNLSTTTIPDDCYAVILDAIQRTVTDKCASKATRKAAFSALSALVGAGGVPGETSVSSVARNMSAPEQTRTLTDLFWKALPVRV
jgi:hypothetical protein